MLRIMGRAAGARAHVGGRYPADIPVGSGIGMCFISEVPVRQWACPMPIPIGGGFQPM